MLTLTRAKRLAAALALASLLATSQPASAHPVNLSLPCVDWSQVRAMIDTLHTVSHSPGTDSGDLIDATSEYVDNMTPCAGAIVWSTMRAWLHALPGEGTNH